MKRERAIEEVKNLVNAHLEYLKSQENFGNYMHFPKENSFQNVVVWDENYHGDSLHNHEHSNKETTLEFIREKYGYSDIFSMLEDIYKNVEVSARWESNIYYKVGSNEFEWDFVIIYEDFLYIEKTQTELYNFLAKLSSQELGKIGDDCDVLIEKHQGQIEVCLYVAGAISLFTPTETVMEFLEKRNS